MAYNILKEMKDQKTGKPTYVLLTDGLSQIWEVKTEKEATKIVKMFIKTAPALNAAALSYDSFTFVV